MLFEDIHSADPTSVEVLGMLIDRLANIPLLLVLTCQPEVQSTSSEYAHVWTLDLARLTRAQSSALVSELISRKSLRRNSPRR